MICDERMISSVLLSAGGGRSWLCIQEASSECMVLGSVGAVSQADVTRPCLKFPNWQLCFLLDDQVVYFSEEINWVLDVQFQDSCSQM